MFGPIGDGEIRRILPATSTRAASILLDVISDILDMSKIEAGRMQLEIAADQHLPA